jgi:hypothetical protein
LNWSGKSGTCWALRDNIPVKAMIAELKKQSSLTLASEPLVLQTVTVHFMTTINHFLTKFNDYSGKETQYKTSFR